MVQRLSIFSSERSKIRKGRNFKNSYFPLIEHEMMFSQLVFCVVLKEENSKFSVKLIHSDNIMDRWIMSFTHSLVAFVRKEMAGEFVEAIFQSKFQIFPIILAYRLYTVVPRLVKYVDTLTNWYVRINRKRLKVIKMIRRRQLCFDS